MYSLDLFVVCFLLISTNFTQVLQATSLKLETFLSNKHADLQQKLYWLKVANINISPWKGVLPLI